MKTSKDKKLYQWQRQGVNNICAKCNVSHTEQNKITVDHIIPISFLEGIADFTTALDDEENFQYLCQACNKMKSSRLDHTNPKTKKLLVKYLL